MRATFVPSSRYRWAYLPRVPERMSSEGYSGRRSWSLLLTGLAFPAGHSPQAEMSLSPAPRSVNATTRYRSLRVRPNMTKRSSSTEWSGSGADDERLSANTSVASAKLTLCFASFSCALGGIPVELHQ